MGASDGSAFESRTAATAAEEALSSSRVRDLGLTIEGSPLAPIVAEFAGELERAGMSRVRPKFYLSTEWGVIEGTVAIAIPFYLARADLTALHAERHGHVEGASPSAILRYLRHEMGHAVNYAYELFKQAEWVDTFGPMELPYQDEFRAEPFSRRFVRHLPGWYAQKHPDEDWAETFAVWMTPGFDWHAEYAEWPEALAKLQYCDRTMARLSGVEPAVTRDDTEEDVSEIGVSLDEFYAPETPGHGSSGFTATGFDSALRSVFEHIQPGPEPASGLIRRVERVLCESVYHWTGHFPERTRPLVRHLAGRADAVGLSYGRDDETAAVVGLSALVTALAMNHAERGAYHV